MAKKPEGPAYPEPAALGVSDMAARRGLSRSRFYVLVRAGVFPEPRRTAGRRPSYPPDLIERCLEVRRTGVGANGTIVMFNRRNGAGGG